MLRLRVLSTSTNPLLCGVPVRPTYRQVSIHIRVLGNWTSKLEEIATGAAKLSVWMEGPYGEPGLDLESSRYQCFLLVSGGIGITPMQRYAFSAGGIPSIE